MPTNEERYTAATRFFELMGRVQETVLAYSPLLPPSHSELMDLADWLGEAAEILHALGAEVESDYDWVPQDWDLVLVEIFAACGSAIVYRDAIQLNQRTQLGWMLEDVESAHRAVMSMIG